MACAATERRSVVSRGVAPARDPGVALARGADSTLAPTAVVALPPGRGGFTLVEAIVLISIVGILGAIAAPRLLSLGELEAARAHRQLLADLRHAQRRAAGSGCSVEVDFEADGYRLRQRSACRSGAFSLELVDPVTNRAPYAVALPAGVGLASSTDPIVLDALGRITDASGTTTGVTVRVGALSIEGIGETGLFRAP